MRSNNDAKLQEALFNIGAYKGIKNRKGTEVTYEQAVDGDFGNMSKQAVKNAENMGYIVDRANGTVRKKKISVNSNSLTNNVSAPGASSTFSVRLTKHRSWTDPITGIARLLQTSSPEMAAKIHAAVPYLRQFTTYNTGGGNWYSNMLPDGGEELLKEIYTTKSGKTGENNYSIVPGTFVYDKYTKKDAEGNYINPRMASAIMSLLKQFGDVGIRQNDDGTLQVYDSYVWEPADSNEREKYRIEVGGIDPLTARMEQIARKAAEVGIAPRSVAGLDDRTPESKRNTTKNRNRNTEDIGTDSRGEYFKKGNLRSWHGVPTWNITIN